MIKVAFIFRKKGVGYSIETLFDNILKYLPKDIKADKIVMKYHTGVIGRFKNLLRLKTLTGYDVYHITGDVYYLALSLLRKKLVITIHDIGSLFANQNWIKRQLLDLFWLKLPLKIADKITVISEQSQNELLMRYPWIKSKIVLIPNCIDDRWVQFRPFTEKFDGIGLVIGVKSNKNLDRIIEAAKKTGIKLIIVGKLSDYQRKLLGETEYQNVYNLKRSELREIYLKSDFLLFPSLYEGFGMPIIEAQALGVPVITSNLPPMNWVASDGALTVNPSEVDQIAKAILALKNNPSLRKRLIENGYRNIHRFLCSKIAVQFAELYKQLG